MKFPVNRIGKKESLDHYMRRLDVRRAEAYRSSVKHQWGEFLNKYPWDFVGHFTFAKNYSIASATEIFQSYLLRYPGSYCYFSVENKPMVHIHALIGRVTDIYCPWKLGTYQIETFDRSKGAAWYVSKCEEKNWQMYGGFPKERPANADRWWRPGITLDPRNIVGLQEGLNV